MDFNKNYKSNATKNATLFMSSSVLLYHTLCMMLFFFLGNILMGITGIIFVLIYLFMYLLIKNNHYFFVITFLTIDMSIFNTLCVILVGWNYGFQLYVFIGIIASFYVKYLTIKKTFLFSYLMSAICLVEFLFLRLYTSVFETQSTDVSLIAFFINSIIAFLTIIFLMLDFSRNISFYENQLLKLSQKDALTGMNNRHNMNTILEKLHDEFLKTGKKVCLGMVDIDDFKKINDSYGHECGDYVLKTIGEMLISMESSTLKTARWGGEEFIVVNAYPDDFHKCYERADVFRKNVEDFDFDCFGHKFKVTVTIGIADLKPEMSIHELIKNADDNLYEGKGLGKNRVIK